MIHPRVGDHLLRELGAWTDLKYSTALRGCETASWRMEYGARPSIPRGRLVTFEAGSSPVFAGVLTEPGPEQFVARGLWTQAKGTLALDASDNPTWTPDDAIDAAIDRGAVDWIREESISSTAIENDGTPVKLDQLLDQWATLNGQKWKVDADRTVRAYTSGGPVWHVTPMRRELALADDQFATHLVGTFFSAPGVYDTVIVGDAAAAAAWGRVEEPVDLTPLGIISSGTATSTLATMLAAAGARLTFAEGLQLVAGQLTNAGGVAAALEIVEAGQVLRIHGIGQTDSVDLSEYCDITIGSTEWAEGSPTISLAPEGLVPPTLRELLTVTYTGRGSSS